MKRALELLLTLDEHLENLEPRTDTTAWMLRELANLLARVRGILEALAASEEQ